MVAEGPVECLNKTFVADANGLVLRWVFCIEASVDTACQFRSNKKLFCFEDVSTDWVFNIEYFLFFLNTGSAGHFLLRFLVASLKHVETLYII